MVVVGIIRVLLLLLPFFTAAWCSSIRVSGIDNEVVILSGNQTVPNRLAVRRVNGIRNRVTIAVAERATVKPGVKCDNVNISSINGIGNRVSITAVPDGQSGRCSNINISSINGKDNHVSIIASPDRQSGGYSNINISSINGIDNIIIIVSGASVTLEDIAATLSRYNSFRFPAETCSQISPAISGYYWIGRRSPKRTFCAFDPPQCGGEGVWRRVAKIDTNIQNAVCPGNFTLVQSGSQLHCSSTTANDCVLAQFPGQNSRLRFKEICGVAHTHGVCSNGCSGDDQLGGKLEFLYSTRYPPKQETLWTYAFATYDTSNCSCSSSGHYCTPKCWYPNYPWFRRVLQESVSGTLGLQLCLDQDNKTMAVDFAEIYIRED